MYVKELIYLAGRFEASPRLREYRDELLRKGFRVSSSWLEEKPGSDAKEMAKKDFAEVRECNLLILDTFDEDDRGGREVEFGCALAHLHLRKVWVVGPIRNIFHHLAHRHFEDWPALFQEISNE